jgi:hypothetical protein
LDPSFEGPHRLSHIGGGQRLKGWQGLPLVDINAAARSAVDFGVAIVHADAGTGRAHSGTSHAVLGIGVGGPSPAGVIAPAAKAILTQEVRNPRAGKYAISLCACVGGTPDGIELLRKNFRCRIALFGYRDLAKNLLKGTRDYAETAIELSFEQGQPNDYREFTLIRTLRSQDGGASEIEMGVGLAIVLERTTAGELAIPAGARAFVQIDDVEVVFTPRPRNDDVKV